MEHNAQRPNDVAVRKCDKMSGDLVILVDFEFFRDPCSTTKTLCRKAYTADMSGSVARISTIILNAVSAWLISANVRCQRRSSRGSDVEPLPHVNSNAAGSYTTRWDDHALKLLVTAPGIEA